MNYYELNTRLIEVFGELEQLCNEIYKEKHGITCYIEQMKEYGSNGVYDIPNWEDCFFRLKSVRYKRNRLSHGEIAFHECCAAQEDIHFVVRFKKMILEQKDPLSLYYRAAKTPHVMKDVTRTVPRNIPRPSNLRSRGGFSGKSKGYGGMLFVIAVLFVILLVLLLKGLIML